MALVEKVCKWNLRPPMRKQVPVTRSRLDRMLPTSVMETTVKRSLLRVGGDGRICHVTNKCCWLVLSLSVLLVSIMATTVKRSLLHGQDGNNNHA